MKQQEFKAEVLIERQGPAVILSVVPTRPVASRVTWELIRKADSQAPPPAC